MCDDSDDVSEAGAGLAIGGAAESSEHPTGPPSCSSDAVSRSVKQAWVSLSGTHGCSACTTGIPLRGSPSATLKEPCSLPVASKRGQLSASAIVAGETDGMIAACVILSYIVSLSGLPLKEALEIHTSRLRPFLGTLFMAASRPERINAMDLAIAAAASGMNVGAMMPSSDYPRGRLLLMLILLAPSLS